MLNTKKTILLMIILLLSIIVSLRGATPDTQAYWDVYKNIYNFNLYNPIVFYKQTGMEIGYGWYSFVLSIFSANSFVLFFIYSLLIFICIYKSSKIINIPVWLVLLFYVSSSFFVIQQFMQIRQGLATSLAFYSIFLLINKKRKNLAFLFLIFSCFIHQVGLLILASYIFYNLYCIFILRIKNKVFVNIILLIIAIIIAKYIVTPLLLNFSERVISYSNTDYANKRDLLSLPNIRAILLTVFTLLFSKKEMFNNKNFLFLLYSLIIGLAFRLGFSDFLILSGRLATALTYSEIFIIPYILHKRFSKRSAVIISLTYFIIHTYISLFIQSPILLDTYFIQLS